MVIKKLLSLLIKDFRSFPKTIYWNFKLLPFQVATKLPLKIAPNVKILSHHGKIKILNHPTFAQVLIGYGVVGMFHEHFTNTFIELNGVWEINGKVSIGAGSKIIIGPTGTLTMHDGFRITANSTIICFHSISFGKCNLISWNCQFMDTDFHSIYDNDCRINHDKPIVIGSNNWFGTSVTVLKGTNLLNGNVVGANSLLNKPYPFSGSIIGGSPVVSKKENITWN